MVNDSKRKLKSCYRKIAREISAHVSSSENIDLNEVRNIIIANLSLKYHLKEVAELTGVTYRTVYNIRKKLK